MLPAHLAPDCQVTLAEALESHRRTVPGLFDDAGDPALAALFAGHDACHVVFGCSTALRDEARVDSWTVLGSTMTARRYLAYLTHPDVVALLKSFPVGAQVRTLLVFFVDLPVVAWRCLRMRRRWDFDGWEAFLDRPLHEVRAEHGIRPLAATPP